VHAVEWRIACGASGGVTDSTNPRPSDWPFPIGELVTGWDGLLPVVTRCKFHMWEVCTEAVPVSFGCGFIQSATCLVCQDTTPAIDASFWSERVDRAWLIRCIKLLQDQQQHLGRLCGRLLDSATSP
jgi:hypothetical protein